KRDQSKLHTIPPRRSSDLVVDEEHELAAGAVDADVARTAGPPGRRETDDVGPRAASGPPSDELPRAVGAAVVDEEGLEAAVGRRSEEHTSELQSRENIVCR